MPAVDTVRFYERRGVLLTAQRRPSGYREFTESTVERIRTSKVLQDMGLALDEVIEALHAHDAIVRRGEAASDAEALARAPQVNAEVAVLDVRMPDGSGIELCHKLRSRLPKLNCLMLTSYADDEALFDAIMTRASGFVLKQVLGLDLINAIRVVGSGGSLLDPRTTASLMDRIRREREEHDPLAALTDQERAVFDLIGRA